jgi:4-amino-4-deoxy-L-arabinose transferase-like glycosyltransferase
MLTETPPRTVIKTTHRLAVTILVAAAIRLAIIPFLFREWLDPFVLEHWAFGRIARSIVAGRGYGSPFADTGSSALLPPVYTYLLAGVFRIFGTYTTASIVAAAAVNSVISALTCLPVFFVARRCFGDRAARWSAWGWALSPYGIYFSADWLWSTCLFTMLLALLFLISLKLAESSSLPGWLGFGILGGVAALTEPVVLAVLPVLAGLSCHRLYGRGGRWLLPGSVWLVAIAVTISPWIIRNYRVFHRFIPVRDGFGLELYLGNSGYSGHWANRSVHPNHSDAELAEYESVGEIRYMDHKRTQAMDFIAAHPAWFGWMTLRRIIYMWTGFWSFSRDYLAQEPLDPPNVLVGTTLSVLAFAGLRRAFREKREVAVRFAGVLLFLPVVYYISHPEAYYFRPLDPLINILVMYAISSRFKLQKAMSA